MNASRLLAFDFTDKLFDETLVIFVLKGKAFPFSGVKDLSGKRVGVMAGWTYGDAFDKAKADKAFTVDEADSDETNIKKLVAGRVDAIIIDRTAATKKFVSQLSSAEMLPNPMQVISTYIVLSLRLYKQRR